MDLHFDVRFYDDHHRGLLLHGPRGERVQRLIDEGLKISDDELLVHAMFQEQRDFDGWRTYEDLRRRAESREAKFRDYFETAQGTLAAKFPASDTERSETERLGVGVAISALNRVAGLTEADWWRIPEGRLKSLDHEWRASDGATFIDLEAKGTVAERPDVRGGKISEKKRHITDKKLATFGARGPTDRSKEAYGVITAVPSSTAQAPVVYLLDPPGDGVRDDPRRARLLARITYYLTHLRAVGQFQMLIALRNRLETLQRVSDYAALDGAQLVNAQGNAYRTPVSAAGRPMFFDKNIVGRVLVGPRWRPGGPSHPIVGFHRDIFEVLVSQDFGELLAFKAARSTRSTPMGVSLLEPDNISTGKVSYSVNSAGVAFGRFMLSGDLQSSIARR